MTQEPSPSRTPNRLSRRSFLEVGAAAVAGSALTMCSGSSGEQGEQAAGASIKQFRTLGRTGFRVSDIAVGAGAVADPAIFRYAYDHGINYFDTAENYMNGASERALGEAMRHMDRAKIWITTKLLFEPEATQEELRERFDQCLARLQTDYVDGLFMHAIARAEAVDHQAFHAMFAELKATGKARHLGISSHGPRSEQQDSMEAVLSKAAADGRFDLMLLPYNSLNREETERVLAVCKEQNVGATAMKTSPGMLHVDPVDPDNLTEDYAEYVERVGNEGVSREEALERLRRRVASQEPKIEQVRPFAEKYGLKTNEQLRTASCQWTLQNPDVHTVCISIGSFEEIDLFVPLSGTTLSAANHEFLDDFRFAHGDRYCRHACSTCAASCAQALPVSTIMRYSYYFAMQGREKLAMQKYASLGKRNGLVCLTCDAPCAGACPHGIDIPTNLLNAHSLLSLA